MELPQHLVQEFAKASKPAAKPAKPDNYGTIKEWNEQLYVQMDGSNILTPFVSFSDVKKDERVCVDVVGHTATVKGNVTNPSIGVKTVNTIVERIDTDIEDLDIKSTEEREKIKAELAQTQKNLDEHREQAQKEFEETHKQMAADKKELTDLNTKAQATADTAVANARDARRYATDYITDVSSGDISQGFEVGENQSSMNYNVRIIPGAVQLRQSSTVLSEFTSGYVQVGQDSGFNTLIDSNGMKVRDGATVWASYSIGEITLGKSDKFKTTVNNDGMRIKDGDNNVVSEFSDAITLGKVKVGSTEYHNSYINNNALQFRKGETVISEFAVNKVVLGMNQNTSTVIDANGLHIYNKYNTTNQSILATYSGTSLQLGPTGGFNMFLNSTGIGFRNNGTQYAGFGPGWIRLGNQNERNVYVNSSTGLSVYNGSTLLSRFSDNTVYLGQDSSNAVIHLCAQNGKIGYGTSTFLALSNSISPTKSNFTGLYTQSTNLLLSGNANALVISGKDSANQAYLRTIASSTQSITEIASCHVSSYSNVLAEYMVSRIRLISNQSGSYMYLNSHNMNVDVYVLRMYASNDMTLETGGVVKVTCNDFKINGTSLPAAASAASVMSLQQDEAIVNLYENQLSQDEAIVSLYETTNGV